MSLDGALFDLTKLQFFAREILGRKTKHEMRLMAESYSKEYNPKLFELINRDPLFFEEIMNIEREKENPRKDYYKFGGMEEIIGFFYNDIYEELVRQDLPWNERFDKPMICKVLNELKKLGLDQEESEWFNQLKEIAGGLGFAPSGKLLKQEPDKYVGAVGDVAEMLRITLTGRKNSPNLYYVMSILGIEESHRRMDLVINLMKK
jgi:glutamyl-tRNA synthetase